MTIGRTIQEVEALDALPIEVRAQAARDRNVLARLRALGKVLRRDAPSDVRHPERTKEFVDDIERRARAQRVETKPKINLAIRPKKKRKR